MYIRVLLCTSKYIARCARNCTKPQNSPKNIEHEQNERIWSLLPPTVIVHHGARHWKIGQSKKVEGIAEAKECAYQDCH